MTLPHEAGASVARHLRIVREDSLRERLLARDEQALVELIDHAMPWVLGVAEGILHDASDAEEVAADVFRQVWDRADTIADSGFGLMPWLLRVARNRSIDRMRARARRSQSMARLASDAESLEVSPTLDIDEAGHPGWHVHQCVHRALAELPAEQRAAVRLAFFSGLTHSEIAESQGIPIGTVKSRLRVAFEKLRLSLVSIRDWVQ